MRKIIPWLLVFTVGCAQVQPTVNHVPNFRVVVAETNGTPGIYSGGETDAAGNAWLKNALHVSRQIKFNSEPDAPGTAADFEVLNVPITFWEQFFGFGLEAKMRRAENFVRPGTYIHCQYGKNRTQTFDGFLLVHRGWSKAASRPLMLKHGWGDSLPGLKWYWETQVKPMTNAE